jgi:hypothetical protein
MFKYGWPNVHVEEQTGQPSAVSDNLVQSVDPKICERQCFTISELSLEFPQISCAVLYKIITLRLSYHKFCARWVPHILMSAHKMPRMASPFDFFIAIPQRQ